MFRRTNETLLTYIAVAISNSLSLFDEDVTNKNLAVITTMIYDKSTTYNLEMILNYIGEFEHMLYMLKKSIYNAEKHVVKNLIPSISLNFDKDINIRKLYNHSVSLMKQFYPTTSYTETYDPFDNFISKVAPSLHNLIVTTFIDMVCKVSPNWLKTQFKESYINKLIHMFMKMSKRMNQNESNVLELNNGNASIYIDSIKHLFANHLDVKKYVDEFVINIAKITVDYAMHTNSTIRKAFSNKKEVTVYQIYEEDTCPYNVLFKSSMIQRLLEDLDYFDLYGRGEQYITFDHMLSLAIYGLHHTIMNWQMLHNFSVKDHLLNLIVNLPLMINLNFLRGLWFLVKVNNKLIPLRKYSICDGFIPKNKNNIITFGAPNKYTNSPIILLGPNVFTNILRHNSNDIDEVVIHNDKINKNNITEDPSFIRFLNPGNSMIVSDDNIYNDSSKYKSNCYSFTNIIKKNDNIDMQQIIDSIASIAPNITKEQSLEKIIAEVNYYYNMNVRIKEITITL